MFGISYLTWVKTCKMYFNVSKSSAQNSLQWFPFSKLSADEEKNISSEAFFYNYIKTGSFVLFSQIMGCSENYLQKGDGSFRESYLISPVLYLVIQAIGIEVYNNYHCDIGLEYTSIYYAGNYDNMDPKYKKSYDSFFKEINACSLEYTHFIKTDISNFFSFINLDVLIANIDKVCNCNEVVFSQTQLQLFKSLLSYIGNGKFPLLENSIASSFLATFVYLYEADCKLEQFLSNIVFQSQSFRMVRYVDDLYIFFSSDRSSCDMKKIYNSIRNEYSSILKEYHLSLNARKCCLKRTNEINEELKKSLYDEYYNGVRCSIEEMFPNAVENFLNALMINLENYSVDMEEYNDLIVTHFSSNDIEFTPTEVFNYYVYEKNSIFSSQKIASIIKKMIDINISFINLDPKRLTTMLIKTKSDSVIKGFLNKLFVRNRHNLWNSYDTNIAISYLLQRKFQHIDLLNILKSRTPCLYEYYSLNCKQSFYNKLYCKTDKLNAIICDDVKAKYLYFMSLCEYKKNSHMVSFAYFKNFFDRVTADFDYKYNNESKLKKPNYKAFHKENAMKKFYVGITDSESVIGKAHDLRNSNPLSHSSSQLIENNNTSFEIRESIKNLSQLLFAYLELKEF